MRTFRDIKGLPVISEQTGKKYGTIQDLCFAENGTILGILVQFTIRHLFLSIHDVQHVGKDAVMIKEGSRFQHIKELTTKPIFFATHRGVQGKELLSSSGSSLGTIHDVYLMEELGKIIGYEATDGFFADITEGRKIIRTNQPIAVSDDAILIKCLNE
ncbi:PRC-barrel domain-containing protein [Bacillus salinus]|uniref:PRC-barrel domain-containing protein n=1 Tax=Bacillus sp. HMF5848 TaxID=2495421 RepID=UPI00163B04BA|nr:PRC-barrel domain-containing protein [Bacillus sp. HMF5848]